MSNNKQSSSIEWLISQLKISTYWNTLIAELEFMDLEIDDIIEQAKAMHKQEIEKVWIDAYTTNMKRPTRDNFILWAENYYNETFGGNK